jgi:nitrate reductase assembly molybdenum cofactor insertion protein NarJ
MLKEKQGSALKRNQLEDYKINKMEVRDQYRVLADLFRYPDADYIKNVNTCADNLKVRYPLAYEKLTPFLTWINDHNLFEIEELFGKTFHIQAICYLDMGYVLFAEDYKRGEFLVQMKRELAEANIDDRGELADNLPNVLMLMSVHQDKAFLNEFAGRVVKVALEKMIGEFNESRIALKDKVRMKKQKVIILEGLQNRNIYQFALEAIQSVINIDFTTEYNDPTIVPNLGIDALSCGSSCSTPQETVKTN